MKINNLQINPKVIRKVRKASLKTLFGAMIISGMITIGTKAGVYASDQIHFNRCTVDEILEEYKGSSEISGDLNKAVFGDVATLEQYLSISEELNKMNLSDFVTLSENDELKSPDDIYTLIELYNEKENREKVIQELSTQEALVNKYIATEGYSIAACASKDTAKAILADAKEEYEGTDYTKEDISIPAETYHSYPVEQYYVNGLRIDMNTDVANLIEVTYEMQHQVSKSYANGIDNPSARAYNSDRNKLIKEALNTIKSALSRNYTANKAGKVVREK